MPLPVISSKFVFLTGKGGVDKTTVACALAVREASAGRRVLLVSTDPASNIGQVFGREIGPETTSLTDLIPTTGLDFRFDAIEIDPDAEAESYRESILGPVRGLLPADVLAATEETLSGSCTVEVASFNRFTDFLTDPVIATQYDLIIFDTAPTGHTLRLLSLPGDWSSFIDKGQGDASCLGPMSGLEKNRQTYHDAVDALADPERTNLLLVARAQDSTLREANRTAHELEELGVVSSGLVINGVLPEAAATDELGRSIYQREQALIASLAANPDFDAISSLAITEVPLSTDPVMGVEGLLQFGNEDPDTASHALGADSMAANPPASSPTQSQNGESLELSALIDDLATGEPKLVMCMGKGGVGKTTLAQAIAVGLARRGKPVHLSTTDPANHLNMGLADEVAGLEVSSIDPDRVTEQYREDVLATKGAALDADGYAQLDEDLRSPCTEEVAVFKAFSEVVGRSTDRWVVLDTAPTGHTLLLLDATGSYHRELMRQSGDGSAETTLQVLQQPGVTHPILVTLPETTPVLEAKGLAEDLERAGITPYAWVVNQSLPATNVESPFLKRRAQSQGGVIEQLRAEVSTPIVELPVLKDEPATVGVFETMDKQEAMTAK